MHKRVIVNSTPIIVLANVNKLELLQQLYGKIIIPQAVYDEVTAKHDSICNKVISQNHWIIVEKINNDAQKKMYQAKLHAGEVEVMILAQENYLKEVKPILDKIIDNGFYLSSELYNLVLEEAKELSI